MVLNAEQHRQHRALQKYARKAAGKLVHVAAFRVCDYTEAGLLRELTHEGEVLRQSDQFCSSPGSKVDLFLSRCEIPVRILTAGELNGSREEISHDINSLGRTVILFTLTSGHRAPPESAPH